MSVYPPTASAKEVWEYPVRSLTHVYGISPSDDILIDNADVRNTISSSMVLLKEIHLYLGGIIRTYFEMSAEGGNTAYGQVYLNGKPHGTLRSTTSSSYVAFTEDLYFPLLPVPSLYQIYCRTSNSNYNTFVRNQRVMGRVGLVQLQAPVVGRVIT